ncbi:S1 family peptidase [Streptosporangium longisporum]|uniref:Alpha-lytic protease prodomain-containing protein n=1 Tax=Streptosporangium longisporum TaxID=46187 RepID=A0ABN3Y160_9ACTN
MSRKHAVATGYVLTITALTLAAVPAGADRRPDVPADPASPLSRASGAPDATGTARVRAAAVVAPPGMLEALQRDLGLTAEQAEERLLNEKRLAPIVERMRTMLGTRFGGAWLRAKTANTLVVSSTSVADIPAIVAAGAQAEVVPRSLTQLADIKAKLDITLPPKPLVSSVRYVDVKRNKVVVLTSEPQSAQNFVQASDVEQNAVVVLPSSEAPQPLYDLIGGAAYYVGVASRCSIGFSVTKGAQTGFVTAGHCGKKGAVTSGFNRVAQGVFQASSFPVDDHAWVAAKPGWTATAAVDNGAGATLPVTGARAAIEGASVCRSGSTSDFHCGLIQQRDASVTYPQGTVFGLTRTSVCAEPGDSGGAFIAIDQAQGVTSGGSGDCGAGGVTYFQPVDEILTAYGLTLKTTAAPTEAPAQSPEACVGYLSLYQDTLAVGQSALQPRGVYYRARQGGLHSGCLNGPAGADFDLELLRWNGSAWRVVASSDGPGPNKKIAYTGTPGRYRFRVTATAGSGPYALAFTAP